MNHRDDPRLDEAKVMAVDSVLSMLSIDNLHRTGAERVGPCPLCGGRDRFGINVTSRAYQCRKCGIKGGDVVQLVRDIHGCGFKDALAFLCGDAPANIDPVEVKRRRDRAEAEVKRQDEYAERMRQRHIADARRIWGEGKPAQGTAIHAYFAARGILPDVLPRLPECLRFHPSLPFMAKVGSEWVELHRGPAMLAAVVPPSGPLTAVHRTWINPERPKGKALITHNGEAQQVKKVLGSKKGCAIRLSSPQGFTRLVMGEGIETTATAWVAEGRTDTAYWAGVDLGNLSGHQRPGAAGKRWSGLPDMSDRTAFVPPPWVRELVLIQDGDSHAASTRAKLESCARRAMALIPGLKARIVHAGKGRDLNDILMGQGENCHE